MSYYERMKDYYDRQASEYEESIPDVGAEALRKEAAEDRPGLIRAISALPPASVLDVACGTGFLTRHLKGEVTGLDQSAAMLEIARQRAPKANFVVGDAFEMPFGDRSFDRVFASSFYGLLLAAERERFLTESSPRLGGWPTSSSWSSLPRHPDRAAAPKGRKSAPSLTAQATGSTAATSAPSN